MFVAFICTFSPFWLTLYLKGKWTLLVVLWHFMVRFLFPAFSSSSQYQYFMTCYVRVSLQVSEKSNVKIRPFDLVSKGKIKEMKFTIEQHRTWNIIVLNFLARNLTFQMSLRWNMCKRKRAPEFFLWSLLLFHHKHLEYFIITSWFLSLRLSNTREKSNNKTKSSRLHTFVGVLFLFFHFCSLSNVRH